MKIASATVLMITVTVLTTGCGSTDKPETKTPPTKPTAPTTKTAIKSGPVVIDKHEVKSGQVDPKKVQQGLQSIVDYLANSVEDARKTAPELHGQFSGTFHIEPNGKVRMFMEEKSAIENEGDNKIVSGLVGAIFGKKISFPEVGDNVLLYVSVRIDKAN